MRKLSPSEIFVFSLVGVICLIPPILLIATRNRSIAKGLGEKPFFAEVLRDHKFSEKKSVTLNASEEIPLSPLCHVDILDKALDTGTGHIIFVTKTKNGALVFEFYNQPWVVCPP